MTVVSRARQRCSRSERVGGSEPCTNQLALQGLQKTSSSLRFSVFLPTEFPIRNDFGKYSVSSLSAF